MRRSDGLFNFLFSAPAFAAALLLIAGGAWAQSAATTALPAVKLLMTVPVPVAKANKSGGMYAYDISFVDQASETYYLGDRSNAVVDVVNAATGKFVKQIHATPHFAGVVLDPMTGKANTSLSGPNGVATGVAGANTCLFAGDGTSRVVSFLLPGGTQVSSLSTKGLFRADEMAYDPKDRILMVANNADTPPFASLIHVATDCKLTLGPQIKFTFATNGAEQPVWDPKTDLFYQAIPSNTGTVASPGPGGLVLGVTTSGRIVKRFTVKFCMPAGLALNPTTGELLLGCSVVYDTADAPWSGTDTKTAAPVQVVMDAATGIVKRVRGIGASDEVWYNSGDDHYYTGSSTSPYAPSVAIATTPSTPLTAQGAAILGVIDGTHLTLDQLVPTFNVPNDIEPGPPIKTIHVAGTGHSVAANAKNNWVLVPAPANNAIPGCLTGCIQVFSRR
jgi:hypothetical protein